MQILNISSSGIDWHVEQRGTGADIVLIPSGEGDCSSFDQVAVELGKDFRVTTFDTPGFSRSRTSGIDDVSIAALAGQIAALVKSLGIEQATFFGCSSGGVAALDIVTDYPELVHHLVIHEVALADDSGRDSPMHRMATLDDTGIARACENLFMNFFNEDPAAWKALGEDFHRRLSINYPTWIKRYVLRLNDHRPFDPAALAGKPITWTIGALFEVQVFFSNVKLAHRADIEIGTLPCRHFPQVSIPTLLSDHIRAAANRRA